MGLARNKLKTTAMSSAEWRIEEKSKGHLVVHLEKNIDINTTPSLYENLIPIITRKKYKEKKLIILMQ